MTKGRASPHPPVGILALSQVKSDQTGFPPSETPLKGTTLITAWSTSTQRWFGTWRL